MLGSPKARHVDRPVLVSLEVCVPPDHFYRHLETTLDLSFVRQLVHDGTGIGRPSLDPVVFFKLQLILFFEGLRSERQLLETASLHLAHRWYLGYALDEPLPDHSSLTRIRQRLDVAIFRRFFDHAKELIGYVADPAVCNACPVKAACTPGQTGRHVHRSLHEAYLDRVRAYHATESYRSDRQ
jgi:transposase